MDSDLSVANIEFLQTVRDVVSHPDTFPDTDCGESPATTSAVRQASDLSYEQVSYRMGESSKLASEGYIKLYTPEYDPDRDENGGFEQRSAELTEKGAEELSKAEGELMGGEINRELVEDLLARVEELEAASGSDDTSGVDESVRSDIESLQADVEALQADLGSLSTVVDELTEEVRGGSSTVAESEQSGVDENGSVEITPPSLSDESEDNE